MLEIEISTDKNQSFQFFPLNRVLRGRIDINRIRDKGAYELRERFPTPIPGIVIGFDAANGTAYLRDPLFDREHADTRTKVEALGHLLGTDREEFNDVHVPTWAHWIRRAVDGGYARIVSGELPEVKGEPRVSMFNSRKSEQDSRIDSLIDLVQELIGAVSGRKLAKV